MFGWWGVGGLASTLAVVDLNRISEVQIPPDIQRWLVLWRSASSRPVQMTDFFSGVFRWSLSYGDKTKPILFNKAYAMSYHVTHIQYPITPSQMKVAPQCTQSYLRGILYLPCGANKCNTALLSWIQRSHHKICILCTLFSVWFDKFGKFGKINQMKYCMI